jgi:hypothetical protein
LGEIFSRAFEIYRNNPVLIVPSLIPISIMILGLVIFAGFMGAMAFLGEDGFVAVSAFGVFSAIRDRINGPVHPDRRSDHRDGPRGIIGQRSIYPGLGRSPKARCGR